MSKQDVHSSSGDQQNSLNSRTQPILDSEEAAALLKIHPKTLQRMARAGEIPGFQIGKLWRFKATKLHEWLDEQAAS